MKRLMTSAVFVLLILAACNSNTPRTSGCGEIPELEAFMPRDFVLPDTPVLERTKMENFLENAPSLSQKPLTLLPIVTWELSLYRCGKRTDARDYSLLVGMFNTLAGTAYATDIDKKEAILREVIENFKMLCNDNTKYAEMWSYYWKPYTQNLLDFTYLPVSTQTSTTIPGGYEKMCDLPIDNSRRLELHRMGNRGLVALNAGNRIQWVLRFDDSIRFINAGWEITPTEKVSIVELNTGYRHVQLFLKPDASLFFWHTIPENYGYTYSFPTSKMGCLCNW
jgi:hypothetical protein